MVAVRGSEDSLAAAGHRLFLDANILFSAAYRVGPGIARLWSLSPPVTLYTSEYAVAEARRNLSEAAALERLSGLLRIVELVPDVVTAELPAGFTLPAKDRPILQAAVAAGATHLLTGDRAHFGRYFGQSCSGVLIERPGDYLRRVERG